MSDTFAVGDVAVKVGGTFRIIPKGSVCRVVWVGEAVSEKDGEVSQCLVFSEWAPKPGYAGFDARNFRKLPKATDEFTEQMRRLKPKAKPRAPQTVG